MEVPGDKKKKVSDFETHYANPSIANIVGVQGYGKKVPDKVDVLITKKDSGESFDGEIDGETHHLEEDSRDRLKFTKLFEGSEDSIGKMGSCAVGVLMYIIKYMKKESDEVRVDAEFCRKELNYKGKKSVYDGLFILLKEEFIYRKAGWDGGYFVNVNKIFKGRRIKVLKD